MTSGGKQAASILDCFHSSGNYIINAALPITGNGIANPITFVRAVLNTISLQDCLECSEYEISVYIKNKRDNSTLGHLRGRASCSRSYEIEARVNQIPKPVVAVALRVNCTLEWFVRQCCGQEQGHTYHERHTGAKLDGWAARCRMDDQLCEGKYTDI